MTYEFECKEHGVFEVFFLPMGTSEHQCECGETCERVWKSSPNVGSWSASLWNTRYQDVTRLNENLKRTNRFIKEPGVEEDTKRNERYYIEKKVKKLDQKIEKFFKERTLDEIRNGIKTDAAILEAQAKGDKGKLHEMGVPMNVEKHATETIEKVKPVVKPRA